MAEFAVDVKADVDEVGRSGKDGADIDIVLCSICVVVGIAGMRTSPVDPAIAERTCVSSIYIPGVYVSVGCVLEDRLGKQCFRSDL